MTGKLNGQTVTIDVGVDTLDIKTEIQEEFGAFGDSCKWYEHESDMRDFSERYPTLVFELTGVGEESGDHWKKYFRNGKMQAVQAKILFEPFNENMLF